MAKLLGDVERLEDQLKLGLVNEVRDLSRSTSKIILKSAKTRAVQIGAASIVGLVLIGAGVWALRSREPNVSEPEGNPIFATQHDWSELRGDRDLLTGPLGDLDVPEGSAALEEEASGPTAGAAEGAGAEQPTAQPAASQEATTSLPMPAPTGGSGLAEDLRVATDKMNAQLLGEAAADLQALISAHPKSSEARQAHLLFGKIHERQGNKDRARATYVELKSRFPGSSEAGEGLYRMARLLQKKGGRERLREAPTFLYEVVTDYGHTQWAPQALTQKAKVEIEAKWQVDDPILKKRVPAALVSYRQLVSKYPNNAGVQEAFFHLGEMYSDLKFFERSAQAYEALGSRFPTNRRDAWWLAGQVYDRRLDDPEKAVEAYEKVAKNSRRYSDAQKRIARLKKP